MNQKKFYAHSENPQGKKHLLKRHLLATAECAKLFAPTEEFKAIFYLAGIFHDIGKYQTDFQNYLKTGKPRTPHAALGAYISRSLFPKIWNLPFVVKGHHSGIPNKDELITSFALLEDDVDLVQTIIKRFNNDFPEFDEFLKMESNLFSSEILRIECATRLLFSALTDADWLDTEHHFNKEKYEIRKSNSFKCDEFLNTLERKFNDFPTGGKINRLRNEARLETAKHFSDLTGFFSLQLPTGLGKTLTSLYWALLHAKYHQLKRIIIVLPYINIIDQTAKLLKDIFGENIILEHHSGIVEDDIKTDEIDEGNIRNDIKLSKKLACENWDAPIIVTTSVQFFESLFSNRPFKCRKNHNIADAVVIFDEVQTLPKHYSEPIIQMLINFNKLAKTSFLFCTATQPAFLKREGFDGIENIQPLIESPQKYFEQTQRVKYKLIKNLKGISVDDLVDEINKEEESLLVICNTKRIAYELYNRIAQNNNYDCYYHLSTNMCPHHRKRIIEQITADLNHKKEKRIMVFSTQLVEAGIDFDFPCVYRAIAPLDSIIQAAGRCNRNGSMKIGKVRIFNLENQAMPDPVYKLAAGVAQRMILNDCTILCKANAYEKYFEELTGIFIETDKYNITQNRIKGNFKTVSENFRLIDSPTVTLFLKDYSDESSHLFQEIEKNEFISKDNIRAMQQYSVQVYRNFLSDNSDQIEYYQNAVYIWHGKYDENMGILPKNINTVF